MNQRFKKPLKLSAAIKLAIKKGIRIKRAGYSWFYSTNCGCLVGAASLAVMPTKMRAAIVKDKPLDAGRFFPTEAISRGSDLFDDQGKTPAQCIKILEKEGF